MDVCEAVGMENQSEVFAPSVPEPPTPVTACAADGSDSDLSELSAGSGSASAEVRSQGWQQPRVPEFKHWEWFRCGCPVQPPQTAGAATARAVSRVLKSHLCAAPSLRSRNGPAGALGRWWHIL